MKRVSCPDTCNFVAVGAAVIFPYRLKRQYFWFWMYFWNIRRALQKCEMPKYSFPWDINTGDLNNKSSHLRKAATVLSHAYRYQVRPRYIERWSLWREIFRFIATGRDQRRVASKWKITVYAILWKLLKKNSVTRRTYGIPMWTTILALDDCKLLLNCHVSFSCIHSCA